MRTWPLLIVILRISSTHFLQRVRVKNSKSGAARARARARLFSRLRNFAGGLAKVSLSEAIRLRFCRFPKRTEEKPQDGVNPLFSPNFRNIERKR